MSFISKGVSYSQSESLRSNILCPLLELYNRHILNESTKTINVLQDNGGFLIPNNDNKYYVLIIKKSILDKNCKENYNILYMFPEQISNQHSDFFMEIDNRFNNTYLLEGYLYDKDDKREFLLTDMLIKDSNVIKGEYELRYSLLNELLFDLRDRLTDLNDQITIGLHPIISVSNQNLLSIFRANFIYNTSITTIEHIKNFNKCRYKEQNVNKEGDIHKTIEWGKYTDVYNVYNIDTNDFEGILYIKGIKESRRMKEILHNNNQIKLRCCYNTMFSKWQPKFE